ncbi:condensin complex subunit 1-like, partial [Stegodyphus dumicola]|uniref:condensin complex subunit 1-like n=1 Tax=Stegodyphus dumicola TaxID=202533 RepID=UPI0015AD1F06
SEKVVSSIASILNDEEEEFDKDMCFEKRNVIKMIIFLLCHFVNMIEGEISKKATATNIGKGRKKKTSLAVEYPDWPEECLKFLVVIKKLFQMPIRKFWDPPVIEYEIVNFITNTVFRLLENIEITKDKGMRNEVFRFLGIILTEYKTGLGYSIKILQLVQDFEHLPSVLAEAVVYFSKEYSIDTLISDIC